MAAGLEPLRVALVGAGRMGRVHLRALAAAPSAAAVAIVDPVSAVRDELAATGVRVHADAGELLAAGGFDAVLVAAPTDLHLDLVATFAAAGVPTLCEKPCGLSADETREATRAAAEAGIVLQIGYWRRFVPELGALRERLAAGELGEPSLVQCWQWDERPPSPAFRSRSGGILVDMGVHEFDQIRWLTGQELGEIAAVASSVADGAPVPGDPDTVQAQARLSGGAIATVSLGRTFPPGDSCWVEVMGTRGHARCEFMSGPDGDRVFLGALVAQLEAFATAVRGGGQRGATGEDAVRAIDAAERATAAL